MNTEHLERTFNTHKTFIEHAIKTPNKSIQQLRETIPHQPTPLQ